MSGFTLALSWYVEEELEASKPIIVQEAELSAVIIVGATAPFLYPALLVKAPVVFPPIIPKSVLRLSLSFQLVTLPVIFGKLSLP